MIIINRIIIMNKCTLIMCIKIIFIVIFIKITTKDKVISKILYNLIQKTNCNFYLKQGLSCQNIKISNLVIITLKKNKNIIFVLEFLILKF